MIWYIVCISTFR